MNEAMSFLQSVAGYTRSASQSSADRPLRLATVDPAYDPWLTWPDAPPPARVTFDGESTLSGKAYGYVGGFIPWPGIRVFLVPIGNTYVIGGLINGQAAQGFWTNAAGTAGGVELGGGSYYDINEGLLISGDASITGELQHGPRATRTPEFQFGSQAMNGPGAGTSIGATVVYPVAWPADTTVYGMCGIVGSAGGTAYAMARVNFISPTQMSLVIVKTDAARANFASGENFTVHWLAFARPTD